MAETETQVGRAGQEAEDTQPIFLLSTERSGSNLVRSILNAHPDISAPHPLETAYPWKKVEDPHNLSDKKARKLIRDTLINKNYSFHPLEISISVERAHRRFMNEDENHSLLRIQKSLYSECAEQENTKAWVSKYPALWDCLEDILHYYQNPRFVYLVRDARDVVLSFKRSNVGRYHPYYNAKRWKEEQKRGVEFRREFGDYVHLIRYKEILQDPEKVVRGVCDFLELDFDQRMLYYYETDEAKAASESAKAMENLSSPIKSDNYDKFHDQLPDDEIKITEKIAGDELREFGYELVYSQEELKSFSLDMKKYEQQDRELARKAARRYWRQNPREQLRREFTKSFAGYMILRYGVLEKLKGGL